jgi:NET1-associated nuclear protein 1 (U3 small nucleolar RNA-associated protein 17)
MQPRPSSRSTINRTRFLIVANRKVIRVYSTSNSLLTRSIKLDLKEPASRIVAFSLSPTQSDILWVACSDSKIFRVDWTTGLGAGQTWGVSSSQCVHMTVASMESAGRRRDVVFTTEIRKDGGFRVAANELSMPDSGIDNAARTIYTSTEVISFLKTSKDGSVIVGSSGKRILVGRLRSTEYNTIDKIRYEFRIFETTDPIRSLDLRLSDRTRIEAEGLKKTLRRTPIVDVVVGDVRGVVFVHNDMIVKLFADGTLPSGLSIMPRKLHWHRQAVNTVKWSLDGESIHWIN